MSPKIILGILIIVGVSLIGSQKSFVRVRFPFMTEFFFLTGTEFLLVGFSLGENLLALLDEQTLSSLAPLLSLVLGWIGFLLGMQVEFRKLRMFPRSYWLATLCQSIATMVLVFLVFHEILRRRFPGSPVHVLTASIALSAMAGPTAQSVLALVTEGTPVRKAGIVGLVRYISSMDGLIGITVLGVLFSYVRPVSLQGMGLGGSWGLLAVNLGIGTTMGFLFNSLLSHRFSREELFLIVMGIVTFGGGVAAYLHLSPLFVCMVMGIVVVNTSHAKERVIETLNLAERPVYLVLLVLAGAMWRIEDPSVFLLAGGYWFVRFIGKWAGGYVAIREVAAMPAPWTIGLALVSQGGVSIAMVLNLQQAYPSEVTNAVISIVLLTVVANELVSPYLTRRALASQRES